MGNQELEYIQHAFDSNWISPYGENIDKFEELLTDFTGSKYCIALNSGTSALHLALLSLGIGHGDTVLCSSFTFAASVNPIIYLNATPIFVGSNQETWNMDPEALHNAIKASIHIGKKPKAIVVVHLYGMPAQMNEILEIAGKYDIPIVEDAAESLGSTYKGKITGTLGKAGFFSFNGNKIISTSSGGALITDDQNLASKVRFYAAQARENTLHYEHRDVGYNYRMSNVLAGIGRGQMNVLSERIAQRRKVFDNYYNQLSKFQFLNFLKEPDGFFCNRWLTCILIDENMYDKTALGLVRFLEKHNIESRPLWKPLHLQPAYNNYSYYGAKIEERMFANGVCLPSGSNLNEDDQNRIIQLIGQYFY